MAARNFKYSSQRTGASDPSSGKVVQLSKALSWLLRHAVLKEGLQFQSDGYVFVEDVLLYLLIEFMVSQN
ncbi:unnamed protein product [Adineta steineri]|uniref:2'-phosphotransferase n=1 Tax=Adineta steineri TaxID=433720 RepID=A0A813N444_9BILA|nr:unnamed protein product [Adineta steineri]